MVNNMREQLVKAGYAQNSRPNMQKKDNNLILIILML